MLAANQVNNLLIEAGPVLAGTAHAIPPGETPQYMVFPLRARPPSDSGVAVVILVRLLSSASDDLPDAAARRSAPVRVCVHIRVIDSGANALRCTPGCYNVQSGTTAKALPRLSEGARFADAS